MARKKPSKRKESVVVDESIYLETAESKAETVEIILEEVVAIDLDLARQLGGSPVVFGKNDQSALKRLVTEGIAADFGEEGHARGYKWRSAVK